jgi:hypothetical protein
MRRSSFRWAIPFAVTLVAACGGDTSHAEPESRLTVLGGNTGSRAVVAQFEAPRSIGTPASEMSRIHVSRGDRRGR